MEFDSTTAVLYAATLWLTGTLLVWGLPMGVIRLWERFRRLPQLPRGAGQDQALTLTGGRPSAVSHPPLGSA